MFVVLYRRVGVDWKVTSVKEEPNMMEAMVTAAKMRCRGPQGTCKTVIRHKEPKIAWTELVGANG